MNRAYIAARYIGQTARDAMKYAGRTAIFIETITFQFSSSQTTASVWKSAFIRMGGHGNNLAC